MCRCTECGENHPAMKRLTVLFSLSVCLNTSTNEVLAQAYPDSVACWNVLNLNNDTCISTSFVMGAAPDTLISGEVYKRIFRFKDSWCFGGYWYLDGEFYVRSDDMGRGYVFLLDSMQEYLSIDNNAQVGDTLDSVILTGMYGDDESMGLGSVSIDSIYTLTINGMPITRKTINPLCCGAATPELALEIFWQVDMGTSYGPVLNAGAGYGFNSTQCMRIQNTNVFSNGPTSGIECDCPFDLTVNIDRASWSLLSSAHPNPSTGLFHLGHLAEKISIYNAQGKLLFRQHGNEVDLSAHPPGVYTAVVQTARGKIAQRLVVMR